MGATATIEILLVVFAGLLIMLSITSKDMGPLAVIAAIAGLAVLIPTIAIMVDVHRLKAEKKGGG